MLLSGVLFVLFLAGCWLYCLMDAVLVPAEAFPGWRKRTWIFVIAVTTIAGAIAWLIARRRWRRQKWSSVHAANLMIIDRSGANIVWYPHPPTEPANPANPAEPARPRTGPRGPDDDPEFLRQLARRIHGSSTDTAE
jgi:hypothetical protein